MTDEELAHLVQNGDKEQYAEIVERYEGKLFGYIRKLINQPNEEVEDLLQEVFISAYVNINGFDAKKQFSSWIYRIAHNKAVDFFKRRRLKKITALDEDNEEWLIKKEKLQEELEIETEEKKRIRKAIRELDWNYKEVVMLYFFEEKSYEEISDILHIPTTNVGVLLYRAKSKLKKSLLKHYDMSRKNNGSQKER
ncbi:RNA polymerase sigma factor [Patescibacteria group bacterium]|nr:RNA polymerase sigma factor [Patescibacteria group bacterium]